MTRASFHPTRRRRFRPHQSNRCLGLTTQPASRPDRRVRGASWEFETADLLVSGDHFAGPILVTRYQKTGELREAAALVLRRAVIRISSATSGDDRRPEDVEKS